MKVRVLQVAGIVFAALFLAGAFSSAQAARKEAKTIDQLVKMYDDSRCKECHEEIYNQWKESWHAKSINSSLGGMRNFIAIGLAKEWEKPLTKAQVLKCLDCHAPAVNFATEKLAVQIGEMIVTAFDKKDAEEGKKAMAELAKINVGCNACHNIKATSVAIGLRGAPKYGAVYGPHGNDSDGHETIESVELKRSVFCMQCHGIYNAPDGVQIQCNTLSGSYQNAYNNLGGTQTCQDCHMHRKDRGHSFPGGHDLDIVKEGLGLDVQIARYRHLPGKVPNVKDAKAWVPSAVLTAFIENKAGHRIPDG